MIPFITRHIFGLPRTRANQNITKLRLKRLVFGICCIIGACIIAALCVWIAQMTFSF